MNFLKYLKEENIKQEDAAKELETSQANISRWSRGVTIPRIGKIKKITAWSNGEVQSNDWYDETKYKEQK
ncbi:MAG: helix-turn-helix transcriptional regulator [Alphaproteobacteria bacterium]|nr:helix-turn-helix transcriptional regulator [Alphaproteobacteria bacterium]